MEVNKLQEMLEILQSDGAGFDPSVINECNQKILEFQYNQDVFIWIIQNFEKLNTPELIYFGLSTICHWIKNNWEMMSSSPDLVNQVKVIIFSQIIMREKLPQHILAILASDQYQLMLQLYPQHWPNFWNDVVNLPPYYALNFLEQFLNKIMEYENNNGFLFQMQMDNSESVVVNFVIKCLEDKMHQAYSVLTQMMVWIDPQPIISSPILNKIVDGLNDPDYAEDSIKLLNGIATSPIDPLFLINLFEQMNIHDKLMAICQNNNENLISIMGYASCLISTCAKIFFDSPYAQSYYSLSLILLSHSQIEVAEPAIDFIKDFTEVHPEHGKESFLAFFYRLAMYFTTNPTEIDSFASSILKSINSILHHNKEILYEFSQNILIDLNSQNNFPNLTAFLNILIDARNDFISPPNINDILNSFSIFLNLTNTLNPQQYYLVTAYMTILQKVDISNEFPKLYQLMFDCLFFHITNRNYSEEQNAKFVEIAFRILKSQNILNNITINQSHILSLIQTKNLDIISLAAKLLSKFDIERRMNVFISCIEQLKKMFEVSTNNTILHLMLIFVQNFSQNLNFDNQVLEFLLSIMGQILPFANKSGQLMCIFLQTLHTICPGDQGLSIFLNCLNNIHEVESLTEVCRIGNLYLQQCTNKSWINEFIKTFMLPLNQIVNNVSNWTDISEETRLALDLLSNFFILGRYSSPYCDAETNENILTFGFQISNILVHAEPIDSLKELIDFAKSLVSPQFASLLAENFIPFTFQIICNPDFTTSIGKWRWIIFSITSFHHEMTHKVADLTIPTITSVVSKINGNLGDVCNEYLKLLQTLQINSINDHIVEINHIFEFIHNAYNHC